MSFFFQFYIIVLYPLPTPPPPKKKILLHCIQMYSYHVSTSSHDYQTTSTLLRLFISIAVTVGVVLVYAKPVLNNDQAGGFLIKQQQQPPNAGEEFVVPYGGDLPNYNLDNPDLNAEPPFGVPSNPTPTIQENPGPADGEPIAFEWLDNINSLILEILRGDAQTPLVTEAAAVKKSREDKFENFKCGEKKSVCCQNSPRISGKRICAKSKIRSARVFFPPLFNSFYFNFFFR